MRHARVAWITAALAALAAGGAVECVGAVAHGERVGTRGVRAPDGQPRQRPDVSLDVCDFAGRHEGGRTRPGWRMREYLESERWRASKPRHCPNTDGATYPFGHLTAMPSASLLMGS